MARVRRPAADWAALIDKWRASGLSLPAFCERRGLNTVTMQGWVYKRTHQRALEQARREASAVRAEDEDKPAVATAFLPVQVAEAAATCEKVDRTGVTVVVGEGRRVVVGAGFDAETLRRVVAVLEDRSC
jgi:hypothetical protein